MSKDDQNACSRGVLKDAGTGGAHGTTIPPWRVPVGMPELTGVEDEVAERVERVALRLDADNRVPGRLARRVKHGDARYDLHGAVESNPTS